MISPSPVDDLEVDDWADHHLYPISEAGLWGFIDESGDVVVQPRFLHANWFSEGLARVQVKRDGVKQSGFIDRTGDFAIELGLPPGVEMLPRSNDYSYGDFHDGRAKIWLGDSTGIGGFIDRQGRLVIDIKYKSVHDFSEGVAFVALPKSRKLFEWASRPYGIVDVHGEYIIRPSIDGFPYGFSNGYCLISPDSGDFVIDRSGNHVISVGTYSNIGEFTEGMVRVIKDRKVGYVDATGKDVIRIGNYQRLGDFARYPNGSVTHGEKDGVKVVVDRLGRIVSQIDLSHDVEIYDFSEGMAMVGDSQEEKYGFIDAKGDLVIPIVFDRSERFRGELAKVEQDGTTGYINKHGEFVWKTDQWEKPVPYEVAPPLSDFLPPMTIASLPLDYEWEGYSNVIVFVSNAELDKKSLQDWYRERVAREYKINCSKEKPEHYEVSFSGTTTGRVDLVAAELVDELQSFVASGNLENLRLQHKPKVVGVAYLYE